MSQNTTVMSKAAASLMETRKYSDFKLICGERTFDVHRHIIGTQSEFFARMFDSDFKEATTGSTELLHDNPDDVARMDSFFYTHDYSDEPTSSSTEEEGEEGKDLLDLTDAMTKTKITVKTEEQTPPPPPPPPPSGADKVANQLVNVAMYVLAEKYLIPGLKSLALSKFVSQPQPWNNGLPDIMRAVYASTPSSRDDDLRRVVVRAVVSAGYPDDDGMNAFYASCPEAHVDVLKEKLGGKEAVMSSMRVALEELERRGKQTKKTLETTEKMLAEEQKANSAQKDLVGKLRQEVKDLGQQVRDAKAKGERMWEELWKKVNRGYCRHNGCRMKFNTFIDEVSDYETGVTVLRCWNCNTKH